MIAEFLSGDLFHLNDVLIDLAFDLIIDLSAILVVLRTSFRCDGKSLGNRKTDIGHFRKVRTFAT